MGTEYDIQRLLEAVDSFPRVRLLVIGDVMLDHFIWGTVERISPEAPVPVVDVVRETRLLGGAANVINNIASAGGRAVLSGVVGQDRSGREISEMVKSLGADPGGLVASQSRPTAVKTRIVAKTQQVVRFDREKKGPLSPRTLGRLLDFIDRTAGEVDGVIISDYGKGVVCPRLVQRLRDLVPGDGAGPLTVDPKISNFHLYKGVSLVTPNHYEAAQGSGLTISDDGSLEAAGRKILEDLSCRSVLITRGEQGMSLFESNRDTRHIPTVARKVFDVTGAGDTVIAIMTLGLAAGLSLFEAAILANFAAGVVVGEVGTSAVTAEKLKAAIVQGSRGA